MKRKLRLPVLLALAAVLLAAVLFLMKQTEKKVTVGDFSGMTKSQVEQWEEEHNAQDNVVFMYRYRETVPVDDVISQSIGPGTKISKKEFVVVTLSNGPDPNEKIELPDFSGYTIDQVKAWFEENEFKNVTYESEIHDELSENMFCGMDVDAGKRVTAAKEITVKYSVHDHTGEVLLPDFTDMNIQQILEWGQKNNIYISAYAEWSAELASGSFIRSDVTPDTWIDEWSTIVVVYAS